MSETFKTEERLNSNKALFYLEEKLDVSGKRMWPCYFNWSGVEVLWVWVFLMVSYIPWSCFVIKPGSGKLVMGFGSLVHLHRPNEIRILGSLVNSVLRWCGDRYPTTALDISEQTSSLSRFLSVCVCVCWAPVTQQQSVSPVCVWVCACVRVVRPLLKVTSGSFRVRRSGTKFCLLFMTSSSQTRKFQPGYWQQKSSILVIN